MKRLLLLLLLTCCSWNICAQGVVKRIWQSFGDYDKRFRSACEPTNVTLGMTPMKLLDVVSYCTFPFTYLFPFLTTERGGGYDAAEFLADFGPFWASSNTSKTFNRAGVTCNCNGRLSSTKTSLGCTCHWKNCGCRILSSVRCEYFHWKAYKWILQNKQASTIGQGGALCKNREQRYSFLCAFGDSRHHLRIRCTRISVQCATMQHDIHVMDTEYWTHDVGAIGCGDRPQCVSAQCR